MFEKRRLALMLTIAMLALPASLPASAAPFTYRDDPFSGAGPGPGFAGSDTGPNANTRLLQNNIAGSSAAAPDLLLMVAWFWPRSNPISMAWSNTLDGWFTSDYLGSGVSLLVTLDNAPGRIRFGNVADGTGLAPLNPTQTDAGVAETRDPNDLVPFLDLGAFAAGEAKLFDLAFTFHFGDGRAGNPGVDLFANTLSANPFATPEPPSMALLAGMIVPALLLLYRRRGKAPTE